MSVQKGGERELTRSPLSAPAAGVRCAGETKTKIGAERKLDFVTKLNVIKLGVYLLFSPLFAFISFEKTQNFCLIISCRSYHFLDQNSR